MISKINFILFFKSFAAPQGRLAQDDNSIDIRSRQ